MTGTGQRHPRRAWVVRLAPAGAVDLDQAVSPPATVDDAVARLGIDPVRWMVEVSCAVVQRIVDEVPTLGGSTAAVETLRRGNEATTLRALFTLVEGATEATTADEATLHSIRELVHRGVPLERVLQGVRVGHAATTEAFLRACAELVESETALGEVTATSRELFSYVDDLADTMIRTYLAEHEVWSTSAAAARADTVRSLLNEAAVTDVSDASRALGYDLRRTHQAVVVWSDSPHGSPTLQAAAIELLQARGAVTTLVIPGAAGRLSAWGTVASDGPHRRDAWVSIEEALSRHQLHAALGAQADGVAGFRRSHREAERTERHERVRRDVGRVPRRVTDYADVAAMALLSTDLDAAADFVRRELGGLADRSAPMEALRLTLYHYLDAERGLADVARRLHIAKGTVTYRVRRAQEVLGHDLGDRRFALQVALTLVEELGDAVLLPRDLER